MSKEHFELVRVVNELIKNNQANTHTMTIGRVVSVNPESIDVQPVINRKFNGESKKLPVFKNVPPMFLQGGGNSEAWPIAEGDYCLLFVCERSFDKWYNGQDETDPIEPRMHDYSDCIAVVGVNPLSSAIPIPEENITREGNTDITGDVTQDGNVTLTGDFTQTGNMEITGNLTVNGNIICTGVITMQSMVIGGASGTAVSEDFFTSHTHPYTDDGQNRTTGNPQGGTS